MLKVYSASAGSGKTYRLAKEYITRILKDENAYRHVLAVTFTNKATEEMKSRILGQLYGLASLREPDEYCRDIALSAGLSPTEVIARAKDMLRRMLNDYGSFSVSTIDRFFQRTMRAFARELGLYGSYTVDLDREAVFSEGIDAVMDSLDGSEEDSGRLSWLIETAMDSLENKGGWNIKGILKDSRASIFSEEFRLKSRGVPYGRLLPKESISTVREHCDGIISAFTEEMRGMAAEALSIIGAASLCTEDFHGASRSPFKRLEAIVSDNSYENLKGLVEMADAGADAWTSKSSPKRNLVSGVYGELNPVLCRLSDYYVRNSPAYFTAVRIRPMLLQLGVMSDIAEAIGDILREGNKVMLDDTNQVLSEIISDDDTPFIYEKLGTRYDDFMLDEFQDTSRLQWNNFLPLVSNSVSQGNETLVVGDVKQSIYRWRSGDWRILGEEIGKTFRTDYESLGENWRSRREIVAFNNEFFTYAVALSGNRMLADVYSDIRQSIPQKRELKAQGGHVHVEFFRNEEGCSEAQDDCIVSEVKGLHERGYRYSDIAVLVRRNEEGRRIVELFKEHGIPTVSEDCMNVNASLCVGHAVRALRDMEPAEVQGKSLYRICEDIFSDMPKEVSVPETAHIYAFLDNVNEFVSAQGDDIRKFLSWWDTAGQEVLVPASELAPAVKVMTVHKSKGLDFKAVILPYFEMLPGNKNWKWLETDEEHFGARLLVPFNLGQESDNTLFAREYGEEKDLCCVDSFNLAYVAFTRSVDELIIVCKPLRKDILSGGAVPNRMSEFLYCFCRKARGDGMSFDFGSREEVSAVTENGDAGHVTLSGFVRTSSDDRLRLTYDNYDYFSDKGSKRGRGQVLHSVMSRIRSKEDIKEALERSLLDGDIGSGDFPEYMKEITEAVLSVESYGWFTGKYDVLNEIEIVEPGGKISRPDRVLVSGNSAVVVDYKFGAPEKRYEKQVSRYMGLLGAMGYGNVKGYLWYVDEGRVSEVL